MSRTTRQRAILVARVTRAQAKVDSTWNDYVLIGHIDWNLHAARYLAACRGLDAAEEALEQYELSAVAA